MATCIITTCTWAWVDASLTDARLVEEALRTDSTLGSAGGRTAHIVFETRTSRSFVYIATLTVWAAWRWHTRICRRRWNCIDVERSGIERRDTVLVRPSNRN